MPVLSCCPVLIPETPLLIRALSTLLLYPILMPLLKEVAVPYLEMTTKTISVLHRKAKTNCTLASNSFQQFAPNSGYEQIRVFKKMTGEVLYFKDVYEGSKG